MQHTTKIIVITERILDPIDLTAILKAATYALTEFELKRHYLIGKLGIASKDMPRNVQDFLLKSVMIFLMLILTKKILR